MYRIKNIIDVKPYSILAEWNTGEKRLIDLEPVLKKATGVYESIKDPAVFLELQTNGKSIFWTGRAVMNDENGKLIPCNLDFCADALYGWSTLVKE